MDIQELPSKSEEASQLLQLLANPKRLQILCALRGGERSVSSLEAAIDLSQSALSQHLARLRAARVVKTRRLGQSIYYALSDERAARLLEVLGELFCEAKGSKRMAGR